MSDEIDGSSYARQEDTFTIIWNVDDIVIPVVPTRWQAFKRWLRGYR